LGDYPNLNNVGLGYPHLKQIGGDQGLKRIKAVLITGRSYSQGMGIEFGKLSQQYRRIMNYCEMNEEDMKEIGVTAGSLVKLKSRRGELVLKTARPLQEVPRGVVFVPYGPWINKIIDEETHSTGMPSLKGIEVEIEPAEEHRAEGREEGGERLE